MERISLNCSCLLLGDYRTSPRSIFISDKGWFMDLNSVNKQRSVDIWITQADILKIFAYLGKERSYVFINLNERKCSIIQEQLGMKNYGHTLDIRSKSESQRRVIIVLDNVVDVCHNILRQRFKFFHELKDKTAAENLFNFACKKETTPKRKSDTTDALKNLKTPKIDSTRAGSSQSVNDSVDDYTSDISFEISKKHITNQALNMELDLRRKKQDILNLRDGYYVEKDRLDNEVKVLEQRINKKEEFIRKDAFPRINSEIIHLQRRISALKDEKKNHLEDLQNCNDSLAKTCDRKANLRKDYIDKIKLEYSRLKEMKGNLTRLKGAEIILNKTDVVEDETARYESLSSQIEKYEKKLECPVCLETCQRPIYQCIESHIICGGCRSRVKRCPQCLVSFEKRKQRHRYAEEDAEELAILYKERDVICSDIHKKESTNKSK